MMRSMSIACVVALLGCNSKAKTREAEPEQPSSREDRATGGAIRAAAIAHAGVGSPAAEADGPRKAVDAALAALDGGAEPLDAAVASVLVLEDDPRFNAGIGSRVRIDGETVQMDASVMTSDGQFGAVAAIEGVRNPIRVARAVIDTPHILMVGDGATRFARTLGLEPFDPATPEMKKVTADIVDRLRRAEPSLPDDWKSFRWQEHWNFDRTLEQAGLSAAEVGHDTVGVAVRASDGRFAVALSTGGTPITLRGRVGDVPILGAGLFAGERGAVAATGTGERIVEATLSRRVHDRLAAGTGLQQALDEAVAELKDRGAIGVIGISRDELASAADREMAWAARVQGSDDWLGPAPAP